MLKHIEKMFVVAMLFYSTRAILPFILGNTGDIAREEGNPLAFAVQTAFYLVAFSFIARQWRTVLRGAWNAKWILLLAFVALSQRYGHNTHSSH